MVRKGGAPMKKHEPIEVLPGIISLYAAGVYSQSCDCDGADCDQAGGQDPGCDSGCVCDSGGDSGECYGG
jgi:hypothetical protein